LKSEKHTGPHGQKSIEPREKEASLLTGHSVADLSKMT